MAYSITPSEEWQKILDEQDEYIQGKKATEYVTYLENENRELNKKILENRASAKKELICQIMNLPAFTDWLRTHDDALLKNYLHDWSGVK